MKKHIWKKSFSISLVFHIIAIITIGAMVAGFYQDIQRPKEELITVNLADTPEQMTKVQKQNSLFNNAENNIFSPINDNNNQYENKNEQSKKIETNKNTLSKSSTNNNLKNELSSEDGILPNINSNGNLSSNNENIGGGLEKNINSGDESNGTIGDFSASGDGNGDANANSKGTISTEDKYSVASRFAQAVESHKSYPYAAVRLNQQGTVIVNVIIDSSGNLISANVVSSVNSNLDKAALNAVHNACPFSHGLGESISMDVPVNFYLN